MDELIEKVTQIIGESLYPDNFGVLLLNEKKTLFTHTLPIEESLTKTSHQVFH